MKASPRFHWFSYVLRLGLPALAALAFSGCAERGPSVDALAIAQTAPCGSAVSEGEICAISPLALRPTQMAVGGRVLDRRAKQLSDLPEAALDAQVRSEIVPCARGPGGRFYLIDRHHFVAALARVGRRSAIARLEADLSEMSAERFRREMERKGWVHLYDEAGRGPRPWSELPRDVVHLKDDPYRALAADVRDGDGYKRSEVPFAEFQWANYFRKRVRIGTSDEDYAAALASALTLAHDHDASRLPGFFTR